MANYSVTVQLDNYWVDIFNKNNTKLCMAKGTKDGSGNEVFNVIAQTKVVTEKDSIQPTMTFTWTDEYKIEASTTLFSKGAKITGTAGAKSIATGQTYNIQSWTKTSVYTDSQNVDNESFGFANQIPCSIVLSMKNGNSFEPVYISPDPSPPGMTVLTPIPKVVFWFQQRVESSTMIVNFVGTNWAVTPSAGENTTIKFDKMGVWSQGK